MGEIKKLPALQIHAETARMLSKLDNGKAGLIIKAMCEYHFNDDPEWLKDQSLRLGFEFLRERIDYDRAAYATRCARNSENAAKRWPKDDMRPDAMASDGIRTDAKHAKLKDKDLIPEGIKPVSDESFALFWEVYPKRNGMKVGKNIAQAKFKLLKADEKQLAITAAKHYAASGQLAKDASRFLQSDYWRDWVQWQPDPGGGNGLSGQYGRSGQGGAGSREQEPRQQGGFGI